MTSLPTREVTPQIVRAARGVPPAAHGGGPRPPGAPGGGGGITGKDVLRILRKRKVLIILSVLICSALAAGVTVLWALYAPLYTAEGLLAVNAPRRSELDPGTGLLAGDVMDRLVISTARLLQRREVTKLAAVTGISDEDDELRQRVADLRRTRWYSKDKDSALVRLEQEVAITPVRETQYIRVSTTGPDREEIAVVVNAMLKAAEIYNNRSATGRIDGEIRRLQLKQDLLNEELKPQAGPADPRERPDPARIADLDQKHTLAMTELNELRAEITRLEVLATRAAGEWKAIENATLDALAETPAVIELVEADPSLRALRARLISIEADLTNARDRYGENSLIIRDLTNRKQGAQKELAALQRELRLKHGEFVRSVRKEQAAAMALELQRLKRRQDELTTQVGDMVHELEGERTRYTAYSRRLERETIARLDRLNKLKTRLLELDLERRGVQTVQILAYAHPPDQRSWPKWRIMMPTGIVLGLMLGLGLAFLLEFIDASIKSPSDVSRRVDLPLLGMVPHADDVEDDVDDMRLVFAAAPNSIVGEAFRQIRTCLLFSGPADERRCTLITSPVPGDGRTTVALNLAAAIARGGRGVLVVDANFRQPAVGSLFPHCPKGGLSSALVGRTDWRAEVHEVEPNLSVMAAGPLPPNPAELLGSPELRRLAEEMREAYDQVIFDGPPCVVVSDSPVLSTQVDSVILVVRAGANTSGIVQRTRDMIARVGGHILGVVLNAVRVTAGGYLRKNYETYYEYHQQAELPEPKPEPGPKRKPKPEPNFRPKPKPEPQSQPMR